MPSEPVERLADVAVDGLDRRVQDLAHRAVHVHGYVTEADERGLLQRLRQHVRDHEARVDEEGRQDQHHHRALDEHGRALVVPRADGCSFLRHQRVHRLVVTQHRRRRLGRLAVKREEAADEAGALGRQ
eukprot:4876887-Prymnesium_polylepis.1